MRQYLYFIFFLLITGSYCSCIAQNVVVTSHDTHIHYMGRITMHDGDAEIAWPGSSITINFRGTGIKATLKDENATNYFNIILDGKVIGVLHPDNIQKEYTLASDLPAGDHSIELFKRTEWPVGKTWFYQFSLDKNGSLLPPPAPKKRKIEFFGNSISCGYADEDTEGKERGMGEYENSYLAYTAITARHYDAEFHNTSRSGIGIMVSWDALIMPEMYNRLDPTDPESSWDFTKFTPDVVVINLFQNDSWIVKLPTNNQFKIRFGDKAPTEEQIIKAYRDFVKNIRSKYRKAQIICALGNMDATREGSPWPGYVEKAVAQIGDKNIYTHFFPYKNTPGHPNLKEQQAMADDLIKFIDGHIKW